MELDERGRSRLGVAITSLAVVVVSTALRFWCKRVLKSGVHAEDWLVLAVVPAYIGATAADLWGLFKGSTSKEITEIAAALIQSPSQANAAALENYLKALYIGVFIGPWGLTFLGISLCLLYKRIFSSPKFQITCTIVMVLSIAWFISSVVVNLVACIPLDAFWLRLKKAQCLNFNIYYLLIGVFETSLDLCILIIPIQAIFTIQLPLKTKLIVSSIFLLGVFTIVTNVLRLYHIFSIHGKYVSLSQATLWTHIHSATAVLCANLPLYGPLRTKIEALFEWISNRFKSSFRSLRDYSSIGFTKPGNTECDGLQMTNIESHPPAGIYRYPGHYMKGFNNTTWNASGGATISAARRSNTSLDSLIVPARGILHTKKVEVY